MPLHLLGKKSWNVYNPANIARVQRDEAEAQKQEQEQERRHRQDEAADRIAALRGEREHAERDSASPKRDLDHRDYQESAKHRASKKRKFPGEDDTDRDIRLAQAQVQNLPSTSLSKDHSPCNIAKSRNHSITDSDGHISLFPVPEQPDRPRRKTLPPGENPSHFYLSDAAAYGRKASDAPWYSLANKNTPSLPSREPWGLTSPRGQQRQAARASANDPLAIMKQGVKRLRESEQQRKEWKEQRERDLREVEDLARQKRKKRSGGRQRDVEKRPSRKHRAYEERHSGSDAGKANDDDTESLDGFNLDEGYTKHPGKDGHRRRSHRRSDSHHTRDSHHHRRRRSRSRSRSRSPRRN
ncbi:uncharacterized protein A1O9_11620 [Exophiala aquamarina CBS 119918]|uniref:CBF1-interacting co-repressor CIR N-terminal domain-containing protein n=1 Tax=Exophiala aquamarina CBS 119918 TaxID=1182545 RepID=A0A072NWZ7_9EURO|nr:uncharacterized protein A1O9_11620 [Exophiala aquamarina CBS 119918]KEF52379.1 hypothetical protein A1O9_11620 [Exophiala aquamarina CBS 119918]